MHLSPGGGKEHWRVGRAHVCASFVRCRRFPLSKRNERALAGTLVTSAARSCRCFFFFVCVGVVDVGRVFLVLLWAIFLFQFLPLAPPMTSKAWLRTKRTTNYKRSHCVFYTAFLHSFSLKEKKETFFLTLSGFVQSCLPFGRWMAGSDGPVSDSSRVAKSFFCHGISDWVPIVGWQKKMKRKVQLRASVPFARGCRPKRRCYAPGHGNAFGLSGDKDGRVVSSFFLLLVIFFIAVNKKAIAT